MTCSLCPPPATIKQYTTQHHMELNNVNTVSDLLAANQAPAPTEHDADSLYQLALDHLDATGATHLALKLVEQLAVYHQNTRNELVEAGEAERACLWAHDEALLAEALYTLQRVTLD